MASTNDNHIQSIDRTYATALMDLAEEAKQADTIHAEVHDLGQLLEHETVLIHLLASPALSAEKRAASIEKIFKGRVSDLLYKFVQVLNHKHRLAALPQIIQAFGEIYEERRGVVQADVTVAARLDPVQAELIAQRLGNAIGRTVKLHQHEDPALIGGLKVRIADRLIDGSVQAQLRIIRGKMIEAGREKARAQAAGA